MDLAEQEARAWAGLFASFADEVAEVLDEGTMDDTTRESLAWLYRQMSGAAAIPVGTAVLDGIGSAAARARSWHLDLELLAKEDRVRRNMPRKPRGGV